MSLTGNRTASLGAEQDGAVLIITVAFMLFVLVITTFVIDEGIWYVHRRHLQTEADAAAFAGAQNFQFPCTSGGTVDQQVTAAAHQYDGTTAAGGGYNQQVPKTPPAANLISLINQASFSGQSQPGDTGLSGSPCTDGIVDVKLSEAKPAAYFPFFSPAYITAQARVSIEQANSGPGEPFAEPLPTPNKMIVELVDESNGNARVAGPLTLTPSADRTTWTTASGAAVTFSDAAHPATLALGLRVLMSSSSSTTCGSGGATCYVNESPAIGVAYMRVWTNSGTPGVPKKTEPVAPQAKDVTLSPAATEGCPNAPSGTFSNFVSSSASCKVTASATMAFTTAPEGTELLCSNSSLTLKANGTAVAMTCPGGGPNGIWKSASASIAPNSGPTSFTLSWSLTAGKRPAGAAGGEKLGAETLFTCTVKTACTGSFDGATAASPQVVQRIYSGAYDSISEATSNSGPIIGATVADASTGSAIMSVQKGTSKTVNITVNALGFQNSKTIPSPPIRLSFGGNQANAALECGGSNGGPEFEKAVAEGCPNVYATTSEPNPPICSNQPPGPRVCAKENPGNGKLDKNLDGGMNMRVNGSKNAKCVSPNRWAAPNTVAQVLTQSPKDPRLIVVLVTDYGALNNGSSEIPIRAFASFYVTGWAGDPCIGQPNGTSNGLAYTTDDNPGSSNTGVLLGHFVKYVSSAPTGTGSGRCEENSFGDCIAVLTR